jgi:amidohydrolase
MEGTTVTGTAEQLRKMIQDLDEILTPMLEFYLELHCHPELSGEEERTADRVSEVLTDAGLAVTTQVGGHGVVGVLQNGPGPTVMLRAELDALPVREQTGVPYASTVTVPTADGASQAVMHACGHDLHLAALCGTALVFARNRDLWRGTLIAVGQPAEETLTGAAAMLSDGLYKRWGRPDVVFAQHLGPFPAGLIAHTPGPVTAGSAAVEVTIHGRGGHPGFPEAALNPIPIAAMVINRLPETFAWEPGATDQVMLSVASIHAGTQVNIIPESVKIQFMLRSLSTAALDAALTDAELEVRALCSAAGLPSPPDFAVMARAPAGANDPQVARRVLAAHRTAFGDDRIMLIPPSMATEDFALFGSAGLHLYGDDPVPTNYWLVGSVSAQSWVATRGTTVAEKVKNLPSNHSPFFIPEPVSALRTAVTAMIAAACGELSDTVSNMSVK